MTVTPSPFPSGGGNPFTRRVLLHRDESGPVREQVAPSHVRVLPRAQILKLTGITSDTLNRWAREGHVQRHRPAPELPPWYDLAEVQRVQQQMGTRRGGRPVGGLGTFPDVAALDDAVAGLMSEVTAALTARNVDPHAAARAVKRWARNRP